MTGAKCSPVFLAVNFKGMFTLEPDSIHIDLIPQFTSYETGSIHYDRVCPTTQLTACTRNSAQLFFHMIGPAFVNRSANMLL